MDSPKPQQRKPRFSRISDQRSIAIQPRDTQIILAVARYRFLSSQAIISMTEGSRQGILRRLQRLFHAGFLDRPSAQIKPKTIGSEPMVYALGAKGAEWLRIQKKKNFAASNRTRSDREVKNIFLDHALMVSNFMAAVELACRSIRNLEFIRQETLINNFNGLSKFRDRINPLCGRFHSEYCFNGKTQDIKLSVLPDQIFGLYFPQDPPGKNMLFFALEADRSTMPVMRSNFNASSYFKKMLGYWEGYRQNIFEELYGFKAFRVLTITKSQDRINNMINAGKQVDVRKKGSRMFLFAAANDFNLDYPVRVFKKVWRNGRDGELISIIE